LVPVINFKSFIHVTTTLKSTITWFRKCLLLLGIVTTTWVKIIYYKLTSTWLLLPLEFEMVYYHLG